MGRLIDGRWVDDTRFASDDGRFKRESSSFRDWVQTEADARFRPEPGRYHLYVSLACPWAHRTVIARELGGLRDAIGLSVVDPHMGSGGWRFSDGPGCIPDPVFGANYLHEIYTRSDPRYNGKVTTPVLFDRKHGLIVNNESREIMRMFTTVFASIAADGRIDLLDDAVRDEVDAALDAIYEPINNGVYRAGFAERQAAYDEAIDQLFAALDRYEAVLGQRRFLCGDRLTEADIALFTTLLRFDPVYHTHFKCNVRRIRDYPNLFGFLRDVYQTPGVAPTCNLDHIRQHYYRSHPRVNPSGVVARGPELDLEAPHGRDASTEHSADPPSPTEREQRLPTPDHPAPPLEFELLSGARFRLAERTPKTFTVVVCYCGLHCEPCRAYLGRFDALAARFRECGVEVVAVSMDSRARAEKTAQTWGLEHLELGHGLSEATARRWGLYISEGIEAAEPARFSEPGVFMVRPGGVLYYVSITNMPFARPDPEELLEATESISEQAYPARGAAPPP